MHLLQSPLWGAFKSQFGWSAQRMTLRDSHRPVQVLYRRLPLGFNIAYIPRGPEVDWGDAAAVQSVLEQLKALAARPATLFLKIEPDTVDDPALRQHFAQAGFVAGKPIQPPNTIIVDLSGSEEAILARMKSKTRYNIRLAQRKGVVVRRGTAADIDVYYALSRATAAREGFANHSLAYYRAVYACFAPAHCALLLAEYQGQPLAGLMVFAWDGRAYYLYGASNNHHRNKMPTYLLQWAAIQWARASGCQTYDLWGIPDAPPETLEAAFTTRRDGLWGVYRHKRGYGGEVVRSPGAFDYVCRAQPHKWSAYRLLAKFLERRNA